MSILKNIKDKVLSINLNLESKKANIAFYVSLSALFINYLLYVRNSFGFTQSNFVYFLITMLGILPILLLIYFLVANFRTKDKQGSILILFFLLLAFASMRGTSFLSWLFATTRTTEFLFVVSLVLGTLALIAMAIFSIDILVNKKFKKQDEMKSGALFVYGFFTLLLVYIYPLFTFPFPMGLNFIFTLFMFVFYAFGKKLSFYSILVFILFQRAINYLIIILEGFFVNSFNNYISLASTLVLFGLVLIYFIFKKEYKELDLFNSEVKKVSKLSKKIKIKKEKDVVDVKPAKDDKKNKNDTSKEDSKKKDKTEKKEK